MIDRLANALLHGLHLCVIGFCVTGWAFEETRVAHLALCGLTLASWFLLGPLIGRPGYCFLTGVQHWLWARGGRNECPNYMSFLFERLSGRTPGPQTTRRIEVVTQAVLYTCTLLSLGLFLGWA